MAPLRTPAQALLAQARTASLRRAAAAQPPSHLYLSRFYHPTTALLNSGSDTNTNPGKQSDRETLNPRRTEGTKSGTDDQVASQTTDAAFNPDKTAPEEARAAAARESNGNPLEASGANQELSRPKNEGERVAGGEDAQGGKKKRSGGSGGKKGGKVAPM